MKIKTVTFALTALVLVALAVIVLWRYHVEIEPLLVEAGPEGGRASSHFQIVFLLGTLAIGIILLFFLETCVFRPVGRASQTLNSILTHNPADRKAMPARFGMFDSLSDGLNTLASDMEINDKLLRDRESNLTHRLRVEEALAKVSRNLLRDREKGIARSLRILGRNFDTDVVSFWSLTRDGNNMHCIGTFRDAETGEFSGEYDFCAPAAQWISEAIHFDQHLVIDDVNNIPEELAVVKEFISEYDLKSFLGVPLKVPETQTGGMVAFGNIHSVRHWSKEDLRALEVVAELLTDHIGRQSGGDPGHCA